MRRLFVTALVLAIPWGCANSPTGPDGPDEPAMRFVDVANGELVDPDEGKIRAELVPVGDNVPGASARVIFVKTNSSGHVVVQTNVWGMEPNTEYQLHAAEHMVRGVYDFGTFVTDEYGNAAFHVSVPPGTIGEFNIVNVRLPDLTRSRQLTSWHADGGSLLTNMK